MISAGNDIVSFAETNPVKSTEPAFYKKFLTEAEANLYDRFAATEISFHQYIWFLWSAKEAAYKYLYRLNAELVFSPIKFRVTQIEHINEVDNTTLHSSPHFEYVCRGKIETAGISLKFGCAIATDYVHTFICEYLLAGKVYHGVKEIQGLLPADQSNEVRNLCLEQLSAIRFGAKWVFAKSLYGVPSVVEQSTGTTYPISLSHHGNFVAYSFSI